MTTAIGQIPVITVSVVTSRDGDCDVSIVVAAGGTPVNLAGVTFAMPWRRRAGDVAVVLDAGSEGYLTTSGADGGLHLVVPRARMSRIPAGAYVADLVATADGKTVVVGTWTIAHGDIGPCLVTAITTTPRNAASTATLATIAGAIHLAPPGNAETALSIVAPLLTVTLSGTPVFSTAFANTMQGGGINCSGTTYSGSATGQRYACTILSFINSGGATLPGSTAGSTDATSAYV